LTGKQNINLKLYLRSPEGAACIRIINQSINHFISGSMVHKSTRQTGIDRQHKSKDRE